MSDVLWDGGARQVGVGNAEGNYVAFKDADCIQTGIRRKGLDEARRLWYSMRMFLGYVGRR